MVAFEVSLAIVVVGAIVAAFLAFLPEWAGPQFVPALTVMAFVLVVGLTFGFIILNGGVLPGSPNDLHPLPPDTPTPMGSP